MQKMTKTEREISLIADGIAGVVMLVFYLFGGWNSFLMSVAAIFGIFFIFAIPFERGWLKKNSWMYKFLTVEDVDPPSTLNLCALPGRIFVGITHYVLTVFGIVFNAIAFLFLKKFDTDSSELIVDREEAPLSKIRNYRIWPIWIIVFLAAAWGMPSALDYWTSDNLKDAIELTSIFSRAIYIVVLMIALVFGLIFPLKSIAKSIWNIFMAFTRRICIFRNIPEST